MKALLTFLLLAVAVSVCSAQWFLQIHGGALDVFSDQRIEKQEAPLLGLTVEKFILSDFSASLGYLFGRYDNSMADRFMTADDVELQTVSLGLRYYLPQVAIVKTYVALTGGYQWHQATGTFPNLYYKERHEVITRGTGIGMIGFGVLFDAGISPFAEISRVHIMSKYSAPISAVDLRFGIVLDVAK